MFFSSSSTPAPSSSSSLLSQESINKGGCNAIKFNPLVNESLLAFTTECHPIYGGCLTTARVPVPQVTRPYTSPIHGLYDCTWSLTNPNLIIIATNLGRSHLIDISQDHNPIKSFFRQHNIITTSVDWCPNSGSFLAASSDGIIKLWSIDRPIPQNTYRHPMSVSCVTWNPRDPNLYASTCYDRILRIWDIRNQNAVTTIEADDALLISCDWNCHGKTCIATASCHRNYIKLWEINQTNMPIKVFNGAHIAGVRRVKFSPHREYQIASSSDDHRVALWDYGPEDADPIITTYKHHQKPVLGLDMSKVAEGWLASCGADGVRLWQHALPEV